MTRYLAGRRLANRVTPEGDVILDEATEV